MTRIYPCLSCRSLNRMQDTDPIPDRCPSCGSPSILRADPRTGRASHVTDTRRLIAEWERCR